LLVYADLHKFNITVLFNQLLAVGASLSKYLRKIEEIKQSEYELFMHLIIRTLSCKDFIGIDCASSLL